MSSSPKLFNLAYIELLILELAAQFGANVVSPIVANFGITLGASISMAGTLSGLMYLVALVLRPFGSIAFAHVDKGKLLLFSAGVFIVSSLLCSFVATLPLLMLSRVLMGIAFILKSTLILTLVVYVTDPENLGRAVGLAGYRILLPVRLDLAWDRI